MMGSKHVATLLVLLLGGAASVCAEDQEPLRIEVQPFVALPDDVRYPEGLAVNPDNGDLYVGTFDMRAPSSERRNQLLRLSADGRLLARKAFGETPLTGLEYAGGQLYILNFGSAQLQRLPAGFAADTPVEVLAEFKALIPPAPPSRFVDNPDGSRDEIRFGSSGVAAPNGMVFDRVGNLYVSDSFQGAVYRIADAANCSPCTVEVIARDPLLATTGYLPFGANGLAFSEDEHTLYINNAGDGRVLRMAMPDGTATVLAESVPGADGLLFHDGLLWVVANQVDQILALNEQGRVVARAGGFLGIAADGSPRGLLFPASTAVQGRRMIVTNMSLPLTAAQGDEWEERVTRWNLVSFELPRKRGN
ncbi:MAG: SMP-30/gluconolactonase/LRE family protein [Pseudomonas sp.]|uniref:SMP-30/gluconolactonase/LRE family protein n=1 Tax=Pseudomonas sp. TaxID=306 RepID=UPI003D12AE49